MTNERDEGERQREKLVIVLQYFFIIELGPIFGEKFNIPAVCAFYPCILLNAYDDLYRILFSIIRYSVLLTKFFVDKLTYSHHCVRYLVTVMFQCWTVVFSGGSFVSIQSTMALLPISLRRNTSLSLMIALLEHLSKWWRTLTAKGSR